MSDVPEIIAGQLHHTKPDALTPGTHVGMVPLASALGVYIGPRDRVAVVAYNAGSDEYDVAVAPAPPVHTARALTDLMTWLLESLVTNAHVSSEVAKLYRGVYCDQIGEFVWGDDAKPFTQPMVVVDFGDGPERIA